MLNKLSKRIRYGLASTLRGRFPGLYSTTDNPLEVPVQVAAYRLVSEKYILPADKVLDVGFGLGYGLKLMAERAQELVGIDIDPKAVANGQKLIGKSSRIREIRHYDGKHIPYKSASFDVVTCIDVIEHVPDYQGFLQELMRVSRRVLVLSTPNRRPENTQPDGKPKNYWHLREWTPSEFAAILEQSGVRTWEWNFINGAFNGPFSYSSQPQEDTQALSPAIIISQ